MKKISAFTATAICLLLGSISTFAQFNTPNIDGVISPNEYGVHMNGQNQQSTVSSQVWYLTWDDTNLYVAVTNANLAEGAVLAIDRNPSSPPNGGTDADGTLNALNYDSTAIGTYPFRADFRTYFKDGYRDYQTANGANGWNFGASGFGSYASGAGNVREFSIPWTTITGGGRPASFLFTVYLSSSGGFIYGQLPGGNAGGNTPGNWNRYFAVVNTNDTTATKPFSLDQTISTDTIQFLGLKHDTFDSYYRSPFGAVPTGSTVNLKFRTDLLDVSNIYLKVYKFNPVTGTTDPAVEYPLTFLENRTEGGTTYAIYSLNYTAPATPSIIYYKFRIVDGTATAFYSDAYTGDHDNLGQGGDGLASNGEPFPSFQLSVYKADFSTPSWLHNSAVYQIFPDRFRNGDITNDWCRSGNTTGCPSLYGAGTAANIIHTNWNEAMRDPRQAPVNNDAYGSQFYGGDLKGVEDKLDYIKNLGFDTIYFTPIFAGRSNHGYDTDNYLQIAPQLGGDAAFQSLVAAANSRNMKIIADGVFNHTSQDSLYMDYYQRYPADGGCESFTSPYRSWFTWNATATTVPCLFTHYNGWFGFGGLPEMTENAEVRDYIYRTPTTNVTQYWLDRGVSGWRFDVADNISHDWWADYRGYAKSYNANAPLIGEVWQDASSFLLGNQLDSVMNYRFRKNTLGFARSFDWEDNDNQGGERIIGLTPSQFNRSLLAVREDYPLPAQYAMLNLLDSHDTNRALYALKNTAESQSDAKERLKLAAIFQFTYIGSPMVYYGDEAGINSPSLANNGSGLPEDDPYNRAPYPWSDESGSTNVYGPADNSLISFYTTLGGIRKAHPALRTGNFQELVMGDITASTTDNNTYAFIRTNGTDKVLVVMNNGTTANTVTIPVGAYFANGTVLTDLLNTASFNRTPTANFTVSGGNATLTIPARSGAILSNFAPTAASASINGRITYSNGFGARRVWVEIQNTSTGQIYRARTDGNGYYSQDGLVAGSTYIITPALRNNTFSPANATVTLDENINNLLFTASWIR